MKLSIVSTMYRSAPFLPDFCQRVTAAARSLGEDFELILVDDGSPDNSLEIALALQKDEPRIQIVELSRNFGHHTAIVAGLECARGERVFLIDCDLEEQPEWLSRFAAEMEATNADVVFGVQEARVANRGSNMVGEMFWHALNAVSNVKIPNNPMTCRLMCRDYVDALLRVEDRVLYLAGTFAWTGFRQVALTLTKTPRPRAHKSTYNLARKLMQVVDSISSFSVAPLTMIFLVGLVIWIGSLAIGVFLFVQRLLRPTGILSGYTSLMLSIWFLSGIIIMALGMLGLYISKIFQEVKRRPLYITRKFHKGELHEQ
jgi:putative glycosyltransferase